MLTIGTSAFFCLVFPASAQSSAETGITSGSFVEVVNLELPGHEVKLLPFRVVRAFEVPKFIFWEALFHFRDSAPVASNIDIVSGEQDAASTA